MSVSGWCLTCRDCGEQWTDETRPVADDSCWHCGSHDIDSWWTSDVGEGYRLGRPKRDDPEDWDALADDDIGF